MANNFNDVLQDAYVSADIVGREQTGFIASSSINSNGAERAAKDQTVKSAVTSASTVVTATPSMTVPEGTDQTVTAREMTIQYFESVQIPMTGEDELGLRNSGTYESVYGGQITQAMRALANSVETKLAIEAYQNASRAVGVAGTTPFASNFDLVAEARQVLVDNGAPTDALSMVMNTTAGTNLRNLAQLQKANENGSDDMLRNGVLLPLQGLNLRESAQVQSHTKGTGAGYLLNDASSAVGDTTITVDTGTGTILAGDIVTGASDTNKYVVNTALSGNEFVIGTPGLQTAWADDDGITVGNDYVANVAFHRAALELAIRPMATPMGGDDAVESMMIQDPFSGLIFEISIYKGYKKALIDVTIAYGVKCWKSDFVCNVLG